MADAIQIFTQSIKFNGESLDLAHLIETSYIERMDVWGPLLILKFNDLESIIRDEVGLKEGDILTVTFGDPLTEDTLHLTETFTVLSMPFAGGELTINGVQSDIFPLMSPAVTSRAFRQRSGLYLCQQLLNKKSATFNTSKNPIIEDYHLLPQTRPLNLMRRMVRETARMAWYARNEFTLKSFDELMSDGMSDAIEYHFNDSRQNNQIADYELLENKWKKKDTADKSYISYDFSQGVLVSGGSSGSPPEWMGAVSKNTLAAMNNVPIPSVLFLASGFGMAKPGRVVKFFWNKSRSSTTMDESLPANGLIYSVTHHARGNLYQNKIMTLTRDT